MMVQTNEGNETIIRFLKRHLDIRTKSGMEWQAVCPFHDDTAPSLSVNIRKGLYICYACGAKGNMKKLSKHFNDQEPVTQSASLEEVTEGIEKLSQELHQVDKSKFEMPYPSRYTDNGGVAEYWNGKRGIEEKVIREYRLGYDEIEDDAIIPLADIYGRVMGMVRRTNSQAKIELGYPKYKYPKGLKISEVLFGADVAVKRFSENFYKPFSSVLVICEGTIDAVAVPEILVTHHNAVETRYRMAGVAILGARMSSAQANIIKQIAPDYILIATDQDRAGTVAEMQVVGTLKPLRLGIMSARVKWNPKHGKDIAELTKAMRKEFLLEAIHNGTFI
jgi:DNA primase